MTTHRLGPVDRFPVEKAVRVKADGEAVVVIRRADDQICVFSDRCPHVSLSLTRGPGGTRYADGVITCPYHSSKFDVVTGENLDWTPGFAGRSAPVWSRRLISLGRKPAPLRLFTGAVVDGEVVAQT